MRKPKQDLHVQTSGPKFFRGSLRLDSKYERICIRFIYLSRWVGGQIVQNMFEQVDFVKVLSHLLFELLTIRTQTFVRSLSQFLSTKL
jgi:hypothetical protein